MEGNSSSLGGHECLNMSRGLTVDYSLKDDSRGDSVGKRASKWDLVSELPAQSKIEIVKTDAELTHRDNHDKDSKSGWDAPPAVSNTAAGWGNFDNKESKSGWDAPIVVNNTTAAWGNIDDKESKSGWDAPIVVNNTATGWGNVVGAKKHDGNKDWGNNTWDRDQSYSTKTSPRSGDWRHGRGNRSPRSGWASSWSRSRSPSRGSRRGIDDGKGRGRKDTLGSVALCVDYTKGRCSRGSDCRYLHENCDQDSLWYPKKYHGPAEVNDSRQQRGRFAGHDDRIHKDPHSQHLRSRFPRDDSLGKRGTESEKKLGVCRDFRAGRCFRESSCRYIHEDDSYNKCDGFLTKKPRLEREMSENKEDEEKWGCWQQTKLEREQRDDTKSPPCRFLSQGSCLKGSSCKYSHQIQETSHKKSKNEVLTGRLDDYRPKEEVYSSCDAKSDRDSQISQWGQSVGPQGVGDLNGEAQVLASSAADKGSSREPFYHVQDKEIGDYLADYNSWRPKEEVNYQIIPKEDSEGSVVTRHHQYLNETSYGRQDTAPIQTVQPNESTTSCIQQQSNTGLFQSISSASHTSETNQWSGVTISADHNAACWPGNGAHISQPPLSQALTAAPVQVSFSQEESAQKTNGTRIDTVNCSQTNNIMTSLLQTNPNIASSQNPAFTNHTVQMTNISSSLAQIFESVQQIPQLYNSLNSAAAAVASAPSSSLSYPVMAPSIQPNQVMGSQSRAYDPIADSMEPLTPEESDQHITMGCTDPDSGKKQLEHPPSEMCSMDQKGLKDVVQQTADFVYKDVEGREACKEAQENGDKEKQTGNAMVVQDDIASDERKNKEAKGLKMFKFALVEAVKEMLKPTWKEGRLSKEVHKTIVKKVVEKVTDSLRGPQVPNTQERIDQYLEFSKSKLTKLVQAYMEKYLKV